MIVSEGILMLRFALNYLVSGPKVCNSASACIITNLDLDAVEGALACKIIKPLKP